MGMTIEQYRCKVGIHVSFVCLFHMNVLYTRSSETREWFNKMCYFHQVYVPLLLRLSNDIEENPGPVLCTKLSMHVKLYALTLVKAIKSNLEKMLANNVLQCL